jgi:hypothetical protein
MSRTHVNLESAIETLREASPSADAAVRIRRRLEGPGSRLRLAPVFGVAGIAVIALAALWPREVSASWLETLERTKSAPAVHRVERHGDDVFYELWQDGDKRATYFQDLHQVLRGENRTDGKRRFSYIGYYYVDPKAANAFRAATLSDVSPNGPKYDPPETLIDELLSHGELAMTKQERVRTAEGERIRYHVERRKAISGHFDSTIIVDAEPDTGRIRRVSSAGTVSELTYPASIPASIFEPRAQKATGVVTMDVDAERRQAKAALKSTRFSKGGVTLRLALIDSHGCFWALWTGPLPNGKLSRPIQIPGIECGPAFGLKSLTQSWKQDKLARLSPVVGMKIGGMARVPTAKIGNSVDLKIPAANGYVSFKGVPVMRVHDIRDVQELLGIGPKPQYGFEPIVLKSR